MKKTFYTKDGKETRDLTPEELFLFANSGDIEAKREIAKKELKKDLSDKEKIDLILDFLDLK